MVKVIIQEEMIINAIKHTYYPELVCQDKTKSGIQKLLLSISSYPDKNLVGYIVKEYLKYDKLYYFKTREDADKFYADFGKA